MLELLSTCQTRGFQISESETNSDAKWRLIGECREKFLREPLRIARELQIAGYTNAAAALRHFAGEMKKFTLMEVSWSDDDSCALEIDIDSESERVSRELDHISTTVSPGFLTDAQLEVLIESANFVEELAWLADDYLLYFEGWIPARDDPDESDDDRMNQAKSDYDGLNSGAVIDLCEERGLLEIASAISSLKCVTDEVVNLPASWRPSAAADSPRSPARDDPPSEGGEVDTVQLRDQVSTARQGAIDSILEAAFRNTADSDAWD